MKLLGEVLDLSTQFLQKRNVKSPRRISERFLGHLLHCSRMEIYMRFDQPINEEELTTLRHWLVRASSNEPVEYILGQLEFFGALIKTDKRALIPRVETELLAEIIAKDVRVGQTVFDLCTGTGCLGISLKKNYPGLKVFLSDLSKDALSLARENAAGFEIEILEGDLFTPFKGKMADIIVCNPPYVTTQEYLKLDRSVRDFEPKMALVGGEQGLDFYQRLSREAPEFLFRGGKLYLEIGCAQGNQVKEIFKTPSWSGGTIHQDLSGKDRFFSLEKQ